MTEEEMQRELTRLSHAVASSTSTEELRTAIDAVLGVPDLPGDPDQIQQASNTAGAVSQHLDDAQSTVSGLTRRTLPQVWVGPAHVAADLALSGQAGALESLGATFDGVTGLLFGYAYELRDFKKTDQRARDALHHALRILDEADAMQADAEAHGVCLSGTAAEDHSHLFQRAHQAASAGATDRATNAREAVRRLQEITAGLRHAAQSSRQDVSPHGLDPIRGMVYADSKFVTGPTTAPQFSYDNDFPYDPKARATMGDYWSWMKWGTEEGGAELSRPDLKDATAAYAHYRANTGTDFTVDYEAAYKEDRGVADAVNGEISDAQQFAEQEYDGSGSSSFHMSGGAELAGAKTEDWQKTLGTHNVWSDADVTVHGDKATMNITVHADDEYNFDKGANDLATGTPDDVNGRFAQLGWAHEFHTEGALTRTVTWDIGHAAGTTQTAPSSSGTDQPIQYGGSTSPSYPGPA